LHLEAFSPNREHLFSYIFSIFSCHRLITIRIIPLYKQVVNSRLQYFSHIERMTVHIVIIYLRVSAYDQSKMQYFLPFLFFGKFGGVTRPARLRPAISPAGGGSDSCQILPNYTKYLFCIVQTPKTRCNGHILQRIDRRRPGIQKICGKYSKSCK
jgi:hypothetical protein